MNRKVRKIGVLGGTFDPIHLGHLKIAEEATQRLGLSQVLFVPASEPWLKEHRNIAPGEHRLAMIELAIAPTTLFRASTVDLDRQGLSYTVDTLTDLRRELGEEANLYFILGLDALRGFSSWREPAKIIAMCQLVGAKRPGCLAIDLKSLERSVPGISRRITILDNPLIDIDSTAIRERVAQGLPITDLVPDAVARYIKEKGLYKKEV